MALGVADVTDEGAVGAAADAGVEVAAALELNAEEGARDLNGANADATDEVAVGGADEEALDGGGALAEVAAVLEQKVPMPWTLKVAVLDAEGANVLGVADTADVGGVGRAGGEALDGGGACA